MDINGKSSADSVDLSSDAAEAASAASAPDVTASQLEAALAEKAQLEDLLLRRQADYDNLRRRFERERIEVRETASSDAVQAVLPILDDFERALKVSPGEAESQAFRDYAKGMELIYQRLSDSLAKLGLEPVASAGQPFNPNLHNAIQREERTDVDDQTVLEEYQRGYLFKGRLLRPAMVKVAVKP